jgi:hypothetical protein
MILWFALIIPIIAAGVMKILFHKDVRWWEWLMMIAVPALVILGVVQSTEYAQTRDTEFWGGWITESKYYEDWDEEVPCRHPIYCTDHKTCTDSEGHSYDCSTTYVCGHHHAYDVDYHPPYWKAYGSNAEDYNISQAEYNRLTTKFDNTAFVELDRDYHSNDGNMFKTVWPYGELPRIEVIASSHSYENRVQASRSIFNFPKVDPKKLKLMEYPPIHGWYQSAVSSEIPLGTPELKSGAYRLDVFNAFYGRKHKARVFLLIFNGRTLQSGFDQRDYWKNGNKNEIVIATGVDPASMKPLWCHVFGWTQQEAIKITCRNLVSQMEKLDIAKIADLLTEEISENKKIIRRDFRDFAYITIDPPKWVIIVTFIVTIIICIGVGLWAIHNEI